MQIKKLITHNGTFHADDVFATAALFLLLEKRGEKYEVTRTRDKDKISSGDFVYDVGIIYDEAKDRFDHHQKGGAGARPNGIEYSSLGLIWKKYGEELSGSKEAAFFVENNLIAPIDASDNGINLVEKKHQIYPYTIEMIINSLRPTWKEDVEVVDEMFFKSVAMMRPILEREITHARAEVEAKNILMDVYNRADNKKILILEYDFAHNRIFDDLEETYFIVYKKRSDNDWGIRAVRKGFKTFENKKDFPKAWGGLVNEDLQKVTGVGDALFCHRALFYVVAGSREGAIKLAELALED